MYKLKHVRIAGLASFITMMATGLSAHAAVHYVKTGSNSGDGKSWATAYTTIDEALDASQPGDEIWVAAGTYKPTRLINTSVKNSRTFILKDGVSLYGGFSGTESSKDERVLKAGGNIWDMANETILSGDDDVPDVWEREISPGTTYRYTWKTENSQIPGSQNNATHVLYNGDIIRNSTVIDGFTITGGNANQHKAKASGGGIYATGNVSINACRIIENSTYFRNEPLTNDIQALGGGIYLNGAGDASVTNCYFSRNYATSSYTIGRGGGLYAKNAKVSGCTFEDCVGEDGGGAVYQINGTLADCTFSNCYGSAGGALYAAGTVERVSASECRSLNGGGIYVDKGGTVTHAKVWNCYADATEYGDNLGGSGGGIFVHGGNVLGCVVYNNMSFNGGGICIRSGRVINSTVQNNATRKDNPAMANIDEWPESGAIAGVANCIRGMDTDASNFTAPTTFTGMSNDDMQKEALALADWSLAAGSEFIDAGTPTEGLQEATDFAGNARVTGRSIDVGAYEYNTGSTGIDKPESGMNSSKISSISYYSFSGMPLGQAAPKHGCYIVRINFTDGHTVYRRHLIK